MRLLNRELTADEKAAQSRAVFAMIERMAEFELAKCVMLYCSLPDELPTQEALKRWHATSGKRLCLPRVKDDSLVAVNYTGSNLQTGAYGILEPQGNEIVDISGIDFIIVPGLAFDQKCNRVGRGKGCYDRFLDKKPHKTTTVGVGFNHQMVRQIDTEPLDVPLDYVVSAQMNKPWCVLVPPLPPAFNRHEADNCIHLGGCVLPPDDN